MSELDKEPKPEEVLAELRNVLASQEFRTKRKLPEILTALVKQALAGDEITEQSIANDVYQNLNTSENAKVRVAMGEIRKELASYYENKGNANSIRIVVPVGNYTPTFERQPQPQISTSAPQAAPAGKKPRISRIRLLVAGAPFAAALLLAGFAWYSQFSPCPGAVSITDPKPPSTVTHKYVVQGTRSSVLCWFCHCNDYVVVEAIDIGQWYVQGRLPDGPQPSLTVTFGDIATPPGTRFSVFVLSTKEVLPVAPLSQSSPIVAGATKSPTIQVTLLNK